MGTSNLPLLAGVKIFTLGCVGALAWGTAEAQVQEFPPDLVGHGSGRWISSAHSNNLRQTFSYSVGGQFLRLVRNQRKDCGTATEWHRVTAQYDTRLRITSLASRQGGEELYVAGLTDRGHDVIERWSWRVPVGQWTLRAPVVTPSPIGVSMGAFTPVLAIEGGGAFEAPPDPDTYSTPEVRTLVEVGHPSGTGSTIGHILDMDVDPEGRFLLLLTHSPRALYRVDLTSSAPQPTLMADTDSIPAIADARELKIWEHTSELRKVALLIPAADEDSASRILLSDPANDGTFEADSIYTPNEWAQSEYTSKNVWKHLYWAPCASG